jgi:hypothetical protein
MNMFLLSSEEWDTVRNEANQAIHELVFLSQFCEAAVDGIGDEEQIRDSIEAIEACLSEIQVCCKLASCTSSLNPGNRSLHLRPRTEDKSLEIRSRFSQCDRS